MSKATPPPTSGANTDDNDRLTPKVAASALDFLLIELVPQIQRTAERLHARELQSREAEARRAVLRRNGGISTVNGGDGSKKVDTVALATKSSTTDGAAGSELNIASGGATSGAMHEDEIREAMVSRLDGLGYRVGQGLVESFSANKPRPQTPLDAIKFICKDLWQLVFRKQIDNLKTNHRGVFVLTDQRFHPLSRMSVDRLAGPKGPEEAVRRAQLYLCFPAGIVRGALAGLGIEATVLAESTELPTATFQIKSKGAKA